MTEMKANLARWGNDLYLDTIEGGSGPPLLPAPVWDLSRSVAELNGVPGRINCKRED